MGTRWLLAAALALVAVPVHAQSRVAWSGGEVGRPLADTRRLATRVPVADAERRERVRVDGDSAQRLAMHDFHWRGRVISVELDEGDERVYWDVKIVPDSAPRTVIRYRLDAAAGGILGIREFTDVGGLTTAARRKP